MKYAIKLFISIILVIISVYAFAFINFWMGLIGIIVFTFTTIVNLGRFEEECLNVKTVKKSKNIQT